MSNYFQPLTVGGQSYDLSHLQPLGFDFYSQMAKRDLRVHVTFSNHCFTKGAENSQRQEGQEIVLDSGNRPRIFCDVRYRLSQNLPAVITGMNNSQCKVWQTASRRNWAYSLKIDNPEGPYHIFLSVSRATAGKPQQLDMMVESAYHETEGRPSLLGRMGFLLLCSNIYLKRPISTKR